MGLNERITTTFEVTTSKPILDIISVISNGKKNGVIANISIADAVDYNEFSLSDTRIEINRRPIFVDAFRSSGTITIDMISTSDNGTILKCRTLPFNGNLPIFVTLGAIGLILWTLMILAFGRNFESFLFILVSWMMTSVIAFIIYVSTKYGLINYSKRVINELTGDIKAGR
jgi:hypothetical protein